MAIVGNQTDWILDIPNDTSVGNWEWGVGSGGASAHEEGLPP